MPIMPINGQLVTWVDIERTVRLARSCVMSVHCNVHFLCVCPVWLLRAILCTTGTLDNQWSWKLFLTCRTKCPAGLQCSDGHLSPCQTFSHWWLANISGHSCFPCRTCYVYWSLLDKIWALCQTSAEVCWTCLAYFAITGQFGIELDMIIHCTLSTVNQYKSLFWTLKIYHVSTPGGGLTVDAIGLVHNTPCWWCIMCLGGTYKWSSARGHGGVQCKLNNPRQTDFHALQC